MEYTKILEILEKDFDFKENHLLILENLHKEGALTADDLAKKTGIPKGRIYDFLNDLLNAGLISKDGKAPAKFNADSFEEKAMNFLHKAFQDHLQKESRLLAACFRNEDKPNFKYIESSEEFTYEQMKLISDGEYVKIVTWYEGLPALFHPSDIKELDTLRKAMAKAEKKTLTSSSNPLLFARLAKTYASLYQEKKFEIICSKRAFDNFIGIVRTGLSKDYYNNLLKTIKHKINSMKGNVVYLDEMIPYNIYLSDKKLLFIFPHPTRLVTGFMTTDKVMINIFEEFFNSTYKRGTNLAPYLETFKPQ